MITEEQALAYIADGVADAADMLNQADPNYARRFKRLTTGLKKLLEDVREDFPDAIYYTAGGGLTLMLGNAHSSERTHGESQQQLIATSAVGLAISDGDF